jgi:hypothetical protein
MAWGNTHRAWEKPKTILVQLHTTTCPLSNPSFRHVFGRNPEK